MGNYHEWGDKDFDWEALGEAERLVRRVLRGFRIGCSTKEKYGTLRCSVYPFVGSLHSLLYPGYAYNQLPEFIRGIDDNIIEPAMTTRPLLWITEAVIAFQLHVGYRLAYWLAMRKYPHIAEEICVDADYPEYIVGGQEIHDKYWTTYKED